MPVDSSAARPLLEVEDLHVHYPVTAGLMRKTVGMVRAVDGVSFNLSAGKTLGVVGESGCGKTTMARAILRLTDVTSGRVHLDGTDIGTADPGALRRMRPKMQMIFQDPHASLNPRMTVVDIIGEPLDEHHQLARNDRMDRIALLMDAVGLNRDLAGRYPHEFSGGQCQRIGIARALALNPSLVVCDEPIAALDMSIQAQIVNLLADLQTEFALSYLFISHDLAMVRHVADHIAVMYLGKIVETAPKNSLYHQPRHPYTQALLSAAPEIGRSGGRVVLKGDVPSPSQPITGCVFQSRCPVAIDRCRIESPENIQIGPDHHVACHLQTETYSNPTGRH